MPTLEKFLTTQGRRKFVLPLFQSLWAQGDWGRPIATRNACNLSSSATAMRKLPRPVQKIVGDLSNTERVLVGLDLRPRRR